MYGNYWVYLRRCSEPSYKKPTRADANPAGHSRNNRGEAASSWTRPEKGESDGKRRKRHVDSQSEKSKTCLIPGHGHSSEEFKVLGDFGTKYVNSRPTKDHRSNPLPIKTINRQQGNNSIINNAVYEILLTENQKIKFCEGSTKLFDSDYDESGVYQVDKIILDDTKEKLEWRER